MNFGDPFLLPLFKNILIVQEAISWIMGEKRREDLEMKETFLARFKGTLEHNVVESYITDYDEFCAEKLEIFSKEIIARELVQKSISLDFVF